MKQASIGGGGWDETAASEETRLRARLRHGVAAICGIWLVTTGLVWLDLPRPMPTWVVPARLVSMVPLGLVFVLKWPSVSELQRYITASIWLILLVITCILWTVAPERGTYGLIVAMFLALWNALPPRVILASNVALLIGVISGPMLINALDLYSIVFAIVFIAAAQVFVREQGVHRRKNRLLLWHNQELVSAREQLLAAVAHELRTPIARSLANLCLVRMDAPDALHKRLEEAEQDLEELNETIGAVMRFGSLGPGSQLERVDSIDPSSLLRDIAHATRALRGAEVSVTQVEVPALRCDKRLLTSALTSIVSNGVRYGRSRVVLSATSSDGEVVFTVDDDGPGVAQEDRAQIFKPMVRLSTGQRKDASGVGLGLAIANRIVKAHGGSIIVTDSPLGGAKFQVRLPTA